MVPYYYLLFPLFSIPIFFIFFRKNQSYSNLPPGRMGWPVIGESLAFVSTMLEGCPEKFFFDRGAAHRAAFKTSLLGEPMVVLCGAAGNKFIFSNEEKLMTSWFPTNLSKLFFDAELTNAAAELVKVRKLVPGLLRTEALRRNVGIMDEIARRHFTAEWGGSGISVERLAKRYTFRVGTSLLASLDDPEEIEMLEETFAMVEAGIFSIPVNLPGTALNRASKAMKVMREELVKVIQRRKANLAAGKTGNVNDILYNMLVTSTGDGQYCSDLEIANCIISLLHGSHRNTSASCASIVKYLTELPLIYEAVRNEQMAIANAKGEGEALSWEDLQKMKYSWNVAREVLRIASPAPGNFREAMTDFTYGGFTVPKGWKVFWSASATHKNPAYFPDPNKFDPTRFEGTGPAPQTFVPFGSGPRMCSGKEHARAKILVFMHNLVKHYLSHKIA